VYLGVFVVWCFSELFFVICLWEVFLVIGLVFFG